jgi:hypothetical protein
MKGAKMTVRTAIMAVVVSMLGLVTVDARPEDGTAPSARQAERATQARKARHRHARRGRAAAANHAPAGTARPHNSLDGQPAHMAPQLEDIPPVKPPKTTPPKADKRNP